MDVSYDIEIVVTSASLVEKIAAILYCLSSREGHTLRTARMCAVKYTPVGEKTAYKIMKVLSYKYNLIYFDTKRRRWLPTENYPRVQSFDDALQFVSSNNIVL